MHTTLQAIYACIHTCTWLIQSESESESFKTAHPGCYAASAYKGWISDVADDVVNDVSQDLKLQVQVERTSNPNSKL
jgi:hypothetical protein